MTALDRAAELLVDELDAAIAAHLDWTRRVLRCAVLRTSPGDDVLAVDAHCRCRFGRWFTQQLDALAEVDATACARVQSVHPRASSGTTHARTPVAAEPSTWRCTCSACRSSTL